MPSQPSFYQSMAKAGAELDPQAAASMISGYRRNNLLGEVTLDPQLMRLAEEQANDHRGEAKRESEGITSAARLEAREITDKAGVAHSVIVNVKRVSIASVAARVWTTTPSAVRSLATRSTSTRPYHDRSSTVMPPCPGSSGQKRASQWWRSSSRVDTARARRCSRVRAGKPAVTRASS